MSNLDNLDFTFSELWELKKMVYVEKGKVLETMDFLKENDDMEGFMYLQKHFIEMNNLYEKLCCLSNNLY